ncbi:hypothetical protein [Roseovarius sp. A-2]|uniref:hypothetical protein n=1 Tax=Roseovarius sp. A-2 TaxID=1570360 RepID=UPI0009B517FD|nr:hypothetical protein [Roseovarius sp. A-2]
MHLYRDPGAFNGAGISVLNLLPSNGWPVSAVAGGFLLPEAVSRVADAHGLIKASEDGKAGCAAAGLARPPRVLLYAGPSVGYPYWGYYAHALLSIGVPFRCVGPDDILANALDTADLLIMPGGFATWGLDRAERQSGIDARVRRFLAGGGGYLGSCGGAFYTADGRPGWLGAFATTPRFTQEYLLAGAGMISIAMEDTPLAAGLPCALEMPYYHGPVYDDPHGGETIAARFRSLIAPSKLFIDNPLDPQRFETLNKRPAVLARARFEGKGRLVVFSPHPEMGEHFRRGVLMEDYVRRYLPIRGAGVIENTLDFLCADDAAGFRLIHNAIHWSCPEGARGQHAAPSVQSLQIQDMHRTVAKGIARLREIAASEAAGMRDIGSWLADRLDREWEALTAGLDALSTAPLVGPGTGDIPAILTRAMADANAWWDGPGTASILLGEASVMAETPIRIVSAALRCTRIDTQIGEVPHG